MNIVLIGFRCAGKTSVGQELARRLSRSFVDCDEYIERKTNLKIREIFDIAGESYFRMLEGDAIADLAKQDGAVIATGGGAALKYKNIRNLKRNGVIIWLDVKPQAVLERMDRDTQNGEGRPPLTKLSPEEEVHQQMDFRRPYYLSAADYVVSSDAGSLEDTVRQILEKLKTHGVKEIGDDRSDEAIA